MKDHLAWLPALILGAGAVFTVGVDLQRALPLREPLSTAVPVQIAGRSGVDVTLSDAEARIAGVTGYLLRNYTPDDSLAGLLPFSLYVGYYDSQARGKTIHSPKNCLPGSGWEALGATRVDLDTPVGRVRVNRYLLHNKGAQALVLYWYQGRGRIESSEYRVKWDLLRDAALRHRSDEALVRVVVPVQHGEDEAFRTAEAAALTLIPALNQALPQ
jgi:EpsI family protein